MHSMRSEPNRGSRPPRRFPGARIAAALALAAGLLAACGGGGPPDQTRPVPNELNGYATPDGRTLQTFNISAKGASGPSRTNAVSGNPSTRYAVSTLELGAPYMVASLNDGNFSVATAIGRANITRLTTLLTIALFGQAALDAFNDYGDASAAQIALINDAEIARAQADATDFLENTLQVHVRSGAASFITTAFEPVAGDTMWDTLVALNARIAEIGPDRYSALLQAFVQRQQQCRRGQVTLALGGATTRFCPATTSSTTDPSDAGVLDHVFAQTSGETLTLRVRGDSLLDAVYATADGTQYTCSGSGCGGLVLGQAAFDTTRSVTFTTATLTGAGGSATATGRVATTVPDVTLAVLPCFVGYVHTIGADGSVDWQCVDNSGPVEAMNISGTIGGQEGASTYSDYSSNGVSIVLNQATLVSITAVVPSADGSGSVTAECRGAACQGVTIGPTTVNMNFGRAQTATRTVSLDGTVLRAVAADGSLTTETPVRLKASLRLITYSNITYNYVTVADAPACTGSFVMAQLVPDDTPQWTYQLCNDPSVPLTTTPLDSGGQEIYFNFGSYYGPFIDTDADGNVVRVRMMPAFGSSGAIFESFGCDGVDACRAVQFGAADANGTRHVSIVGAVFHNVAPDGFASGPRTGRVDAAFDVVPAQ